MEGDKNLLSLNEWIEGREASAKNEYTGLFEGKNLILITAESFSPYIIDAERTPTLYKLATEGMQFTNFYTPLWGVSTSDGEFVTTTSLIPKTGVWSYTEIADNYMPYALGSLFSDLGARSFAFHDHSYTYYNRQYSYPNMGYEYYGQGGGLSLTEQWPESDVEMVEATVPMFIGEDYFHVYYLTVSGHLNYSYLGNSMAAKHRDEVEDLDYSEPVKAYLACNMELEYALEELLEQLEEAGKLEDTVIALAADHYPYGLSNEEYAELRGVEELDTEFELYRNAFLLWTPGHRAGHGRQSMLESRHSSDAAQTCSASNTIPSADGDGSVRRHPAHRHVLRPQLYHRQDLLQRHDG